jgi:hypothetical protein
VTVSAARVVTIASNPIGEPISQGLCRRVRLQRSMYVATAVFAAVIRTEDHTLHVATARRPRAPLTLR